VVHIQEHVYKLEIMGLFYLGVVSRSWLVLRRNPRMECVFAAQFVAELKFHVLEVDSITGEIEGDEAGFAEEYPLEDVELTTTDFMAKARLADSDFRCAWESIDKSGEVLEKFGLHFKELESAVSAVITCLGMQPEDNTQVVVDNNDPGAIHSLHLSGIFTGNIRVLVRAQLHIDEKAGCILKMAVRSSVLEISQIVVDCIK
jgi:coatomer protein complex subunit gamma